LTLHDPQGPISLFILPSFDTKYWKKEEEIITEKIDKKKETNN
jgi:hypothetical protein